MASKTQLHSSAYKIYRDQYIELWNFAAMICYAVPTLNKNIKGVEEKVPNYGMVKPDFMPNDKSTHKALKLVIKGYEKPLTSYLWISNFAFFEAYIKRVLDEFIEFHGGKELYYKNVYEKLEKGKSVTNVEIDKYKVKLQKKFDGRKMDQYRKHTWFLQKNHYVFPSLLLSSYGLKKLIKDIDDIRAKDIPEILSCAFLYKFSKDQLKKYMRYKDKRNNLAHGENIKYSMSETIEMFDFFNTIAWDIDQYLMNYFFVNERFFSI